MPKKIERIISNDPKFTCFRPDGVKKQFLKEFDLVNELKVDEFEAFRLSHFEGLSMKDGAEKMGISASTFNRILKSSQEKIADSLVKGKAIRVFRSDGTHNCD